MRPSECYRFEACNAPVCPLAPDEGVYIQVEKGLCYVAQRLAKGDVEVPSELGQAVLVGMERVLERYPRLRARLDESSKKPVRPAPHRRGAGKGGATPQGPSGSVGDAGSEAA